MTSEQHGWDRMSYLQIRQHRPYRPLVPERTREGLAALVPEWGLPRILEQLKDHTREELKVSTYIRTTLVPWTEPQQDGHLISGERKSLLKVVMKSKIFRNAFCHDWNLFWIVASLMKARQTMALWLKLDPFFVFLVFFGITKNKWTSKLRLQRPAAR